MVCFCAKNLFFHSLFWLKIQQKITKIPRIRAYDFVPCRAVFVKWCTFPDADPTSYFEGNLGIDLNTEKKVT